MKKVTVMYLIFFQIVLLCSCSEPSNLKQENRQLIIQIEELKTQVEELTAQKTALAEKISDLQLLTDKEEQEKLVQEGDITVVVTNKSVTPKNSDKWIFNNYVNIVCKITNNTEKDIQGIKGYLITNDLFNSEILTLGCDFTGTIIPSGESITNDNLSYECNEFIHEDMKLFNENFENLKFIYEVEQIVFTDGTIKTIKS